MFKTALLLLIAATALAVGNPTRGGEKQWVHRTAKLTPNTKTMPHYESLIKSYVPIRSRIRGTHVVKNCGQTNVNSERIVGGDEAVPHAYPWQVSLYIDDMYFCGGAIISEEWVLASGLCLHGTSKVEILAGAHNTELIEPSQVRVVSNTILVHEKFSPITFQNDIALIKMDPITFTPEIGALCLPNYSDARLPSGTEVTITGWGATSDIYPYMTNKLRVVKRPSISNVDCKAVYGVIITDGMICVDTTGGHGTCTGDSGGPMTVPGTCGNVDCVVSRGITSFEAADGCKSGFPHGFTRTHSYLDWIEANTGIAIGA